MITIGKTTLNGDSTREIREAITIRVDDLNKERKRLEDRFLHEGAAGVGPEDEPTEGEQAEWDEGPEASRGEPETAADRVTVPAEPDDVQDLLNP